MAKHRKRKRSGALGTPTKQDFEQLATILCVHQVKHDVVANIATWFGARNPRFDRQRFIEAARTSCKRTKPWV
jgi:hypothetical protein